MVEGLYCVGIEGFCCGGWRTEPSRERRTMSLERRRPKCTPNGFVQNAFVYSGSRTEMCPLMPKV